MIVETEHLPCFLDGSDVQHCAQRAVRQLQAVTRFQVPGPYPALTQVLMALQYGSARAIHIPCQVEERELN